MPGIDTFGYQSAFVVRQGGQHVQHQPAGAGCRINPIRKGAEHHFPTLQQVNCVQHIDERPIKTSARHTTKVSAASAWSRSCFIPGRSTGALHPEATSEKTSHRCTARTQRIQCSCTSWAAALTLINPSILIQHSALLTPLPSTNETLHSKMSYRDNGVRKIRGILCFSASAANFPGHRWTSHNPLVNRDTHADTTHTCGDRIYVTPADRSGLPRPPSLRRVCSTSACRHGRPSQPGARHVSEREYRHPFSMLIQPERRPLRTRPQRMRR